MLQVKIKAQQQAFGKVITGASKVFIGGMLLSAVCPLPNKKKYWASKNYVPKLLSNSMQRDQFLNIMYHLHFQDNAISTKDYSAKLRPLTDNLQKKNSKSTEDSLNT